jgi:uncharacterized membrane protein YeiB
LHGGRTKKTGKEAGGEFMRKSVLWAALDFVFLAVFNIVFFTLGGTEHKTSVWLSYGFIIFAYAMVLITPLTVRRKPKSMIFGFSIYSVSAAYFFLEFVTGIIFILLNRDSCKYALVCQVIIAGIYAAVLIVLMLVNERAADSQPPQKITRVKESAARAKKLIGKMNDKKADRAVKKLYAALRSAAAAPLQNETDISDGITELESAVQSQDAELVKDIAGRISSLAAGDGRPPENGK